MYQFSDSDSKDSDDGIRFKTDSTRNKTLRKRARSSDSRRDRRKQRTRSKSGSRRRKEHSPTPTRRRMRRSRSRDKHYNCKPESSKESAKLVDSKSKKDKIRSHNIPKDERSSKTKIPGSKASPEKTKPQATELCHDFDQKKSKTDKIEPKKKALEAQLPSEKHIESKAETSNSIGPLLPPHFLNQADTQAQNSTKVLSKTEVKALEPELDELPKNDYIGPQLPPHLFKQKSQEEPEHVLGPQAPPTISENVVVVGQKCIGPEIPPELRKKIEENGENDRLAGPDPAENEEIYGPLPVSDALTSRSHIALEERAMQLKIDQLGEDAGNKEPAREEWMLELPDAKASNLGLGPRQFRAKAGPDMSDRSAWTDTPKDKALKREKKEEKKVDLRKEAELKEIRRRDREQEVLAKKSKKRDKASLVEIHEKKRKKEKKTEGETSERRPFSRDVDLQVNRFDEAQKKAVLKKAALLDDRFSSGQSKFL